MPDWRSFVQARIASLRLPPAAEPDLAEELAQHLEDRYRELCAAGIGEEEASRQITAEFSDLAPLQAVLERRNLMSASDPVQPGSARSGNLLEDLWKDLRYAGRTMHRNPLFVLFAVLTLGLGIGANTAVFTLLNTVILNPLPIPDASGLASVAAAEPKNSSKSTVALPISYLNLKDYQTGNQVFSSLAGYTPPQVVTLKVDEGSERRFVEFVTGNYFSTLGLKPSLGRFFLPQEDTAPGAHPVAVMNYQTWQGRFGGQDIIGKKLRINSLVITVIGVAPPEFLGVNAIFGPDLWIPAAMAEQLLPNGMRGVLSDRGRAAFLGAGRLKPGISRVQAEANLVTIASALARRYPDVNESRTVTVRPITDVIFSSSNSGTSPILFGSVVLLIVVGVVLLIACSNVANLLLARSAARQHEIAIRLAIGASRARLIRQYLTESVLLGLLGGIVGLAAGSAGLELMWSFRTAEVAANLIQPRLDPNVFAFTLLVALFTGFAFGILPALRASRVEIGEALQEEARSVGRSRRRITFANALLVGQVALSFLLLVMAALFLRSIGRAYQMDPGFQTAHLAIFMTNPGQAGYDRPRIKAFYQQVRERVATLPGIQSVSWASNLPLWGRLANGLQIEGREQHSQTDTITTILNTVDPGYFEAIGVPIEAGREFTEMDREDSASVAIVNEKLAHDYWPNQSALGKRLRLPGEKSMRQIVGVARTANYSTLAEPPQPCVYLPLEQSFSDAMVLYVRSQGDPQRILMPVRREVHAVGPEILLDDLFGMRTGSKIIEGALFQAKMGVTLLTVFGLLALGLASIGLYGIMAYSVTRRTREIGVRMAMGAARGSVLGLILKQGLSLVAAGVLIGFGAALLVGRLLTGILYGISASDPVSVAAAAGVLLTVAFIACYLPARYASRLDPLAALREG